MKPQNEWSIDEIQQTWQLASKLHDGQKYGGADAGEKVEYLNHIGSVVFEVLNAVQHTENMNADLALKCAILHDTIEDTPFSYEKVQHIFGDSVANGVLALTKNDEIQGKQAKMLDSLQRIKAQPTAVWAVKLADRIANLQQPPHYWNAAKKRAYIAEAELIFNELKDGNTYLAKRLAQKIKDYHRFL